MKYFRTLVIFLTLLVVGTGCLKTRAQLKDDGTPTSSDSDSAAAPPAPPQNQYAIDELKSEVTRLTGRIEDLEHAAAQKDQAGDSAQADLKKVGERIAELEQAQMQMLEAIKKLQATAPVADQPELYSSGKSKLDEKSFDGAVSDFSEYLKNPKGKYVEDATFYRGDAYYGLKQYKKAIIDYSKFPEKWSKSKHLPQALYKIGLSFDALGMHDDAKGFYQELLDKFPQSPEARKIRPRLK